MPVLEEKMQQSWPAWKKGLWEEREVLRSLDIEGADDIIDAQLEWESEQREAGVDMTTYDQNHIFQLEETLMALRNIISSTSTPRDINR